ncbi:leucine-zipper-like transcriptional regulator 1 [Schistocerca gregaria]|uniref:leucine-zipper-like transcriptional regulator 1 n=1 Tax=Schistocerca gregaria TaxID=7010 RepID=UPI00211EC753|nr:leucine-zipper-like transcriptional regulator 1 [Schistocerca gregaria]
MISLLFLLNASKNMAKVNFGNEPPFLDAANLESFSLTDSELSSYDGYHIHPSATNHQSDAMHSTNKCCTQPHDEIGNVFGDRFHGKKRLTQFPRELLVKIFKFFNVQTLFHIASVCKLFNNLVSSNLTWLAVAQLRFPELSVETLSTSSIPVQISKVNWRAYYLERLELEKPLPLIWKEVFYPRVIEPRYAHTGTVIEGNLYIIGGENSILSRFNDVHCLNLETSEITKCHTRNEIQLISRHQAIGYKESIYVFGGYDGVSNFNNLKKLDTVTQTWSIPKTSGQAPICRSNHGCVLLGHDVYIFGGNNQMSENDYQVLGDFYKLDLEAMRWEDYTDQHDGYIPSRRSGHRLVEIGGKIWMFGGGVWCKSAAAWKEKYNQVNVYDPVKRCWRLLEEEDNASVCTFSSCARMGFQLAVWGGQEMETNWTSSSFFTLDTITLRWRKWSIPNSPKCRDMGVLVAIGNHEMLLFGGNHGGPKDDWHVLQSSIDVLADVLYDKAKNRRKSVRRNEERQHFRSREGIA